MDYKFPGLFTLKRRSCACIFLGRKVCILCGRSTPFFYLGKEEAKKICIHIGKHADAHDTLEFE